MFDRSWCKSNFFPSKISSSYRKYRFEKIFLLYHSSQKFNALEFEGETRRSMQVSSGNSKISSKNCLSIFPFYNLRFIPRVARKNKVETKIGKFLERIGKVSIEDRFFPPSHPLLRPLRRVSSRESFLFQPTIEKFPSKISCRWEVLLTNVYARSFVRLPSLLHFPRPILRLQLVNSLTRKF